MNTDTRLGDSYTTRESPNYSLPQTVTTLAISAVLMLSTVVLMVVLTDTVFSEVMASLYEVEQAVGVLVVGGLLSVGRLAGLKGANNDNQLLAGAGATLLIVTYGTFGAVVLQSYQQSIWLEALVVTSLITIGITLVAGAYVYSTSKNLEHWAERSGTAFLIGIVLTLIGIVIPHVLVLSFVFFLAGFVFDLIYEIWKVSSRRQTILANGIGLYVAFAGVFVHILILVLEMLADN